MSFDTPITKIKSIKQYVLREGDKVIFPRKNSFTLLRILYCRLGNELKQLFEAPDLLVSVQTISSDLLLQQKLFCYYWIYRLSFVHIKQENRKQLSVISNLGAVHTLRATILATLRPLLPLGCAIKLYDSLIVLSILDPDLHILFNV